MRVRQARNFFDAGQVATLCSHSKVHQDYPFGSLVQYDVTEQGEPIIYVSRIAQHYKNLLEKPHASIFVSDPNAGSAPLSCPRITVMAEFSLVDDAAKGETEAKYVKRFPASVDHRVAHDFVFFKGCIKHVRWIGGFGDIAWIGAEEFCAEPRDEVAYNSASMIEHMNEDHQDALGQYVQAFSDEELRGAALRLAAVSASGFSVRLLRGASAKEVWVPFEPSLSGPDQARTAFINLLKTIRE
ncbi:MAG: DUF2470 domain-containing protein [Bdellovibrionales bacterium]|nr:DUF2470 domain-containing protein [Bdellovibrionales bacterium]